MDYKNMFSLEGRKAVITGGCGYLGREIVKGMVDYGADVYVIDYKISEIEDISEPSRIHYISCDLGDTEAIKAALKDYYDRHGIAYDESQFPAAHDCEHCGV